MSTCNTADGIDHGEHRIDECIWAMIERYKDGYIFCPILWSGGRCEECMEVLERRMERDERPNGIV